MDYLKTLGTLVNDILDSSVNGENIEQNRKIAEKVNLFCDYVEENFTLGDGPINWDIVEQYKEIIENITRSGSYYDGALQFLTGDKNDKNIAVITACSYMARNAASFQGFNAIMFNLMERNVPYGLFAAIN